MNIGTAIVRGLLAATPVVGGFAAYTATRERGWGTWSSAFAAAGAALVGAIGGNLTEGLLEEKGVISGVGLLDVQRRRVAGWQTPGDLRRSGNLYGMRGQSVPANVNRNWRSKGPLGLIEVRRYA